MNLEATKRKLRSELLGRERPGPAAVVAAGERMCALLVAEPAVLGSGSVALYAALPDEVSTRPLFDELIRLGRRCLFPRMLPTGRLAFVRVEHIGDLRPARHGIAEPPPGPAESLGDADVVIVPGIAFDRAGTRLGRGGGYYDRTFSVTDSTSPRLIGASYADRIVDSLPCDSHDRAMDAIVTERAFSWVRSSG